MTGGFTQLRGIWVTGSWIIHLVRPLFDLEQRPSN